MKSLFLALLLLPANTFAAPKIVNADVAASGTANIARNKLASGANYAWCVNSASGYIADTAVTASSAVATDANGAPVASATTATELGYVSGVTSAIQTQLNGKQTSGNYITALTADVTASGPGSVASTVAKIQGTTVSGTTGTTNVVFSSAPTLSNPVVGTQAASDNSTKAASTAYVTGAISTAIAGVNPAVAVQAATTAASDTSGLTYSNGASGIGATLTGVANTALVVDGYTFTAVNQRLLVKNDTQSPSGAFNGVYYVTQIQTAIVPIILTRALDYDMPSDINNTGSIPVVNGTVNGTTSWVLTSQVTTVGTDPLTFTKFSINPSTILTNVLTNTHILVGNVSAVATDVAAGGDVSLANTGAFTVSKVNGVSYGASPSTNTIPVVTSSNTITYETAPVAAGGTGLATLTAHSLQVGNGTSNVTQIAVPASGTILTGVASSDPAFSATPTLGVATTTKGTLSFAGNTSGTVTIQPAAAAGTWSLTLPTTAGSNTDILQTDGSGVTSWVASTVTAPRSEVLLYGGSGFGSTNLNVRRYTSTSTTGTDLTITQSATNGDLVTVNTTGVYCISVSDQDTVGQPSYILNKNSTATSTDFSAGRLGFVQTAAATAASLTECANLVATDVIRWLATVTTNPQTSNQIVSLRVTKVSN